MSSTIQLVFSSSSTVYGWPKEVPCTEESPISAANPYGRTKVSFLSCLVWSFQCSAGLMKRISMILKSKKGISLTAPSMLRLLSSQVLYLPLSFSFNGGWGVGGVCVLSFLNNQNSGYMYAVCLFLKAK